VIFVTVGTNEARFDRLLRGIEDLGRDEEVLVQHGHTPPTGCPNCIFVDFLPFEQMLETMRQARVVVTHAGVGSVMVALSVGKRPVVVPRRQALGEAVDDHQLQLGRRFAETGLVTLTESEQGLHDAIQQPSEASMPVSTHSALAREIRGVLEQLVVPLSKGR
jgi:UDP-N-acetylglucosamine transferase subunit ALG13